MILFIVHYIEKIVLISLIDFFNKKSLVKRLHL